MFLFLALAISTSVDPRISAFRGLSDEQICASLNRSAPKAAVEHNGPAQINEIRPDCSTKKLRIFTRVPVSGEKSDAYLEGVTAAAHNQICVRKSAVTAEFLRRGWTYEYHVTFSDGSSKVLPIRC